MEGEAVVEPGDDELGDEEVGQDEEEELGVLVEELEDVFGNEEVDD